MAGETLRNPTTADRTQEFATSVSSFQRRHCALTKVQCNVSQPRYWLLARGASRQFVFSEGQEIETCSLLLLKRFILIITKAQESTWDSCFGDTLCEGVSKRLNMFFCIIILDMQIIPCCIITYISQPQITTEGSTITIEHHN